MRVGRRGARRCVFVVRQEFTHFPRRVLPFVARVIVKDGVGERAPAHIPGEDGLLVVRGVAVFPFEFLKQPDGREIVARLLVKPALADPVGVRYAEVAGGQGLYIEDDSSGSRISRIASSQAWWYSIFLTDTSS